MEQGTKKIIMFVVIVVCLVAAGAITYMTGKDSSGAATIKEVKGAFWLKCRNPKCEHSFQMEKQEYYEYMESKKKEMGFVTPGIPCPKCGEESCYRAEKCPKCGVVFERDSVPNDLSDRCPECGYSETENIRNSRRK